MRLALIYHQFIPRGGLEGYLAEFASRLAAAGHELEIITGEVAPEMEKKIAARWHRVLLIKGSPLLRMWQFERLAPRMAEEVNADVTIGFGRTTTHGLHRAGGGCHRVYSELLPFWKRWSVKNQLELQLEKELYTEGRTNLFILNSSQVARQLHKAYGTEEDRFRVIHTAVDTERFKPAPDKTALRSRLCAELKTDSARPVFLFVSLSHRRKGLDVLLDAWREVDADLWIVGKPLDFSERRKVAQYNLQSKIRTLAAQSDMRLLYQAADWFVHPTQYDACANTVLQSMASGLPGLISVNDGAIDLVRDGENGLLLTKPRDAGSVLATIQNALAMDEKTRRSLGELARETMMLLTWEAHLAKWMDVIGEVGRMKDEG